MELGELILADGRKCPLAEVVERVKKGDASPKPLHSRGFEVARIRSKLKCVQLSRARSGKIVMLSQEEILWEEIRKYARNKPMIIIGFIMILMRMGYGFWQIGQVDLHELIIESEFSNFNISFADVKRVVEKIEESELLLELVEGNRMGLQKAYHLYR